MIARTSCEGRRVWDTARGVWAPAAAPAIGRGLGAAVPLNTWCDQASAWNPLAYLLCLPHDVAHVYDEAGQWAGKVYSDVRYGTVDGQPTISMPAPPPPGIAITADASAAKNPAAVYAGTLDGQVYYAVPQSPQENMAEFRKRVGDYFDQVGDAADAANCKGVFGYFDSTCPNFTTTLLIGGALVAGLVFFGGRR